jgi:hypothetical protein
MLAGALATFGLAASGATGLSAVGAQPAAPAKPHRIDIHHHLAPPAWLAEIKGRPMPSPPMSPDAGPSIEDMDKGGVAMSVLPRHQSGPVVRRQGGHAPHRARESNDYAAKCRSVRTGLASSPPCRSPTSHARSRRSYAYDTLHADGITS